MKFVWLADRCLLVDMNLTPRWTEALSAEGHEVVHWSAIRPISAPDSVIFEYARNNGFVLIYQRLGFSEDTCTSEGKPRIVLLRGEPLVPEARGKALIKALAECSEELNAGAALAIDWSGRVRARLLPLKRSSSSRLLGQWRFDG